jgi:hypothetical protein
LPAFSVLLITTFCSRRAFLSYTRSYSTYPKELKDIFHVRNLHLGHVATSFGLREKVNFSAVCQSYQVPDMLCIHQPSHVGQGRTAQPSSKQKRFGAKQTFNERKKIKKQITQSISLSEFASG